MNAINQGILGTRRAMATIAVRDIDIARNFYQDVLGLVHTGENHPGVLMFASADTMITVYESQYAGTNKATAATWVVDADSDIADVVAALKEKDIVFEHYDFPGTFREGDVHVSGNIRAAWFKDPDSNILSIVSQ